MTDLVSATLADAMRYLWQQTPPRGFHHRRRRTTGGAVAGEGAVEAGHEAEAMEMDEGAQMARHGRLSSAGSASNQATRQRSARLEGVQRRLHLQRAPQATTDSLPR